MKNILAIFAMLSMLSGCSSTTAYYPPTERIDSKGNSRTVAAKAFQTYGDSLGNTSLEVLPTGIRYAATGGNFNSPTTGIIAGEVGRTTRFGISWGFMYGILNSFFGHAGSAYSANQAASATKAASAAKASGSAATKLPQVGSTIPAQTTATVQGAAAIPAAGSTIPATVPAVITPVP